MRHNTNIPYVQSIKFSYEEYLKKDWARFFLYEEGHYLKLTPMTLMEYAKVLLKNRVDCDGKRMLNLQYAITRRGWSERHIMSLSRHEWKLRKKIVGF